MAMTGPPAAAVAEHGRDGRAEERPGIETRSPRDGASIEGRAAPSHNRRRGQYRGRSPCGSRPETDRGRDRAAGAIRAVAGARSGQHAAGDPIQIGGSG
jgi:hypothetical protein